MESSILGQVELPIPKTAQEVVTDTIIYRQPDASAALKLSIQASGLDDKQVYMALDIDAGQWSRIMHGSAHFPHNKLVQFMEIVDNQIFLIWLAYKAGKGIHDLEDAKDRRIRELEQQTLEQQREIATLVKYGVLPGKAV